MPNTTPTVYVLCDNNCRWEAMTKEQIITAIAEATGTTPTSVDDGFITKIKETNANTSVRVWRGTEAQFNALANKATDTLYLITDNGASNGLMAAAYVVSAVNAEKAIGDKNGDDITTTYYKKTDTVSNATNATNATTATNANNVKAKDATFKSLQSALLEMIYPVGSIYMSVANTSPSTFLGGTWAAWGSGKVPVGVDTSNTNFNTVEKTGGETTHRLTEQEMPNHTHTGIKYYNPSTGDNTTIRTCYLENRTVKNGSGGGPITVTDDVYVGYTGSGNSHNNLQPYITCYMWKRTA